MRKSLLQAAIVIALLIMAAIPAAAAPAVSLRLGFPGNSYNAQLEMPLFEKVSLIGTLGFNYSYADNAPKFSAAAIGLRAYLGNNLNYDATWLRFCVTAYYGTHRMDLDGDPYQDDWQQVPIAGLLLGFQRNTGEHWHLTYELGAGALFRPDTGMEIDLGWSVSLGYRF